MTQTAFNFEARSLARGNDPQSSHAAARKMVESGSVATHEAIILNLLRQYPGRTSKQLAAVGPLDRVAIARRLKKMEEKQLIRRVEEGKQEIRWYVSS